MNEQSAEALVNEQMDNYKKYRGRCKEFVDAEIEKDPTLKAVRGWYDCPYDGRQAHWWCVRLDGTIFDPTQKQFKGPFVPYLYIPYTGTMPCCYCGEEVEVSKAVADGNRGYCSQRCYGKDIGFY